MRFQESVSVAANLSSGNVLAGKQLEFPERPSRLRVFAVSAATGIRATISSGTETLLEESHVSFANRFPLDPDDKVIEDGVLPGKRLSLVFRNTTGAAIVVQFAVDVTPVA